VGLLLPSGAFQLQRFRDPLGGSTPKIGHLRLIFPKMGAQTPSLVIMDVGQIKLFLFGNEITHRDRVTNDMLTSQYVNDCLAKWFAIFIFRHSGNLGNKVPSLILHMPSFFSPRVFLFTGRHEQIFTSEMRTHFHIIF
jgi:hypothetical protein